MRLRFDGCLCLLGAVFLDDFEGEVLEFGDQGAEFLRVVEQGLVFGQLVRRSAGGWRFSRRFLRVHSAVGAVQPGRVGVAAAVRLCPQA
jgi:hypothetical protein